MNDVTGRINADRTIQSRRQLQGSVKGGGAIVGTVRRAREQITGVIALNADIPFYTGSYEITPSVEDQSFPTQGRRMRDDLTVFKIPYQEVTNISGGTTATIGGS